MVGALVFAALHILIGIWCLYGCYEKRHKPKFIRKLNFFFAVCNFAFGLHILLNIVLILIKGGQ